MRAFGWDVGVSRPTAIEEWRTNRAGCGPVTHFEARGGSQIIALQVAQDQEDMETWVTVISVHPVTERLQELVKRLSQTWRPSLRGVQLLFSPLRLAYISEDRARLADVSTWAEVEGAVGLEEFRETHGIEMALHEELDPSGSSPRWAGRVCAVLPADAYELMAALFVGQRVVPIA